ncbi:MAG: P-loop NTPase [Ignavibacteria bacterium]|nr:P-loop NTPase [Ignavibacteria bacterium]
MNKSDHYIISVCSGKNGTGKSIIAANLAYELSRNNRNTVLCDTNFMSPTLHILFGIKPYYGFQDLIVNNHIIDKITCSIGKYLKLIACNTAQSHYTPDKDFVKSLEMIITSIDSDCIIFDCNSGANNEVLECCKISDIILLVMTDEPSSVIDTYGLIKIIRTHYPSLKIYLVINNVIDMEDADDTANKLNQATALFLSSEYDSLGFIPYDRMVKSSIIQQKLLNETTSTSLAAIAINTIALAIDSFIQSNQTVESEVFLN